MILPGVTALWIIPLPCSRLSSAERSASIACTSSLTVMGFPLFMKSQRRRRPAYSMTRQSSLCPSFSRGKDLMNRHVFLC